MTPQAKTAVVEAIEGLSVTATTLAILPQTLGPFADILPERYKVTVATVGASGFVLCKLLNIFWPLLQSAFPAIGNVPGDLQSDANKPVPPIPVSGSTSMLGANSMLGSNPPIVRPAGPPSSEHP